MILMYDGYTITGTVDEIKEFIEKMKGTTVINTLNGTGMPIDDLVLKEDLKKYKDVKTIACPHCGSTYFRVLGSQTTLVDNPLIIKDGKVQQHNTNKVTTQYKCLSCDKTFESSGDLLLGSISDTVPC